VLHALRHSRHWVWCSAVVAALLSAAGKAGATTGAVGAGSCRVRPRFEGRRRVLAEATLEATASVRETLPLRTCTAARRRYLGALGSFGARSFDGGSRAGGAHRRLATHENSTQLPTAASGKQAAREQRGPG
jgi:hypothetical protein